MSRFLAFAVTGTLVAAHVCAGDVMLSPKRQVVNCMIKQMSVSKTISYNDASKLCKGQVRAQSDMLADTAKPPSIRDYRSPSQNQ